MDSINPVGLMNAVDAVDLTIPNDIVVVWR
jgi:hypothetical protein